MFQNAGVIAEFVFSQLPSPRDTLAIIEYLHDKFPGRGVWPEDMRLRARARSLAAEMHAGFGALRSHCPMNIEADLREVGQSIWGNAAKMAEARRRPARAKSDSYLLTGHFHFESPAVFDGTLQASESSTVLHSRL
jgi:glutathione S-transferase